MSSRRPQLILSTVGLVVLALVTAGLSVAAVTRNPTAVPQAPQAAASVPARSTAPPVPQPTVTQSASPTVNESTLGDPESTTGDVVAVVVGDRYTTAEAPAVWVDKAASTLGWDTVVNLSAAGRGYLREPEVCDLAECSTFSGTIGAIAAQNPDVVVTFGGTADGDQDLRDAAAQYFQALREALPNAELIAISPVTSEDEAEYWLTLHAMTIRAGVEAVGGTFVDVGQPGVGDGEQLSPEAQDAVAQEIVAELS